MPLPTACAKLKEAMWPRGRYFGAGAGALAALAIVAGVSLARAAHPARQSNVSEQVNEVVATLASGKVTVIGARDGLVVTAVGTEFEPDSLPPLIVPLGQNQLAVVLGAAEWTEPALGNRTLLRLDRQLPHLTSAAQARTPTLTPGPTTASAANLGQFGLSVLEPLRTAAQNLHSQLKLPQDLPLAEIVLVRQNRGQAPDVWDISYWVHQTFWQTNYWDTEVQRPRTTRLYPTDNDQSGVIEVRYPPSDSSPGLVDLLTHPTGRLAQAVAGDSKLASAQRDIAGGKVSKTRMAQLVPLVKTALETTAPATAAKAMVSLDAEHGFSWIIQPAQSKIPSKRPPGAPTLKTQPR